MIFGLSACVFSTLSSLAVHGPVWLAVARYRGRGYTQRAA